MRKTISMRFILCLCFVMSGAASVSYQTIWLRDAMTYFGVITPVISSVLSTFMLGLAIGTLLAGRISRRVNARTALAYYAGIELLIGIAALCVPALFYAGYEALLKAGDQDSGGYLLQSGIILTLILLPVCTLIGATLPFIMKFLESESSDKNNFGYLYFANLVGALIGCLTPVVLVELYGFKVTLVFTAVLNFISAILCAVLFMRGAGHKNGTTQDAPALKNNALTMNPQFVVKCAIILFLTGFVALGSEVVWIRSFTRALGTTVYSFASVLAVYLTSSFLGTWCYLKHNQSEKTALIAKMLFLLPAAALLPLIFSSLLLLSEISIVSIVPVCFIFGYLTPYLIDVTSANNPVKAARMYTYNFLGCILGPLVTTYILFPLFGLKGSLIVYAGLLFLVTVLLVEKPSGILINSSALFLAALSIAVTFPNMEDYMQRDGVMYRDHVGYVGGVGKGMQKRLLINGIGMTSLTTITKNMAHLPLAYHPDSKSVLTICFGMGTTVRSFTAWPLEKITVAELSSGVVKSFGYFHDDAQRVLADPRVHIVVDDGRRFLNRTGERFDIITIDPPPPVPASGSGLLYSTQFISLVKSKLAPNGILAHWVPGGADRVVDRAVVNAIKQNFKYVIIYKSVENWGIHILASDSPFPPMTPQQFVERLPEKAVADLKEWYPGLSIQAIAGKSLHRVDEASLKLAGKDDIFMSDDRLYNEFYLLRKYGLLTLYDENR